MFSSISDKFSVRLPFVNESTEFGRELCGVQFWRWVYDYTFDDAAEAVRVTERMNSSRDFNERNTETPYIGFNRVATA